MIRQYYDDRIEHFLSGTEDEIIGRLAGSSEFAITESQRDAWKAEIDLLKKVLSPFRGRGKIYFEYSIPRLGRRIDVVLLIEHVLFVLEFKINATEFSHAAMEQVCDYALDIKNFHQTSHNIAVVPILIATGVARASRPTLAVGRDGLCTPVCSRSEDLRQAIENGLAATAGMSQFSRRIDPIAWEAGRYNPTPTIVEAAQALYAGHGVADISRSDAAAINLSQTSHRVSGIIAEARQNRSKAICLITGVPGAGKTLVGLDIAAKHTDRQEALHSVYLSGNGPLVDVLREALARDQCRREKESGRRASKVRARSEVKQFIQNVHHFRDECLRDRQPPIEHVALFDEAQRAWNLEQTRSFMKQKRGDPDFNRSEPEFLISCMDRHSDWAVVVCLIGGGQEINTGEAGIAEWLSALLHKFPDWRVYLSSRLGGSEYAAGDAVNALLQQPRVQIFDDLHLSVSMRSFRAENLSLLVRQLLDLDEAGARETYLSLADRYPIKICRNLVVAKRWIRQQARGSERYGLLASSRALRLKPEAIDIRTAVDPVQWFLNDRRDIRSSYYLEDAATEYKAQGLELDWTCVAWDADFRRVDNHWGHYRFRGREWTHIRKPEQQRYQKNAYRVLLTRARQGMVIVVPAGDPEDPTRLPAFYDATYEYLRSVGFPEIRQ